MGCHTTYLTIEGPLTHSSQQEQITFLSYGGQ
uniref:Uncharacterized protein n=1 Tax=Anguilla anguilla TaxID=7936 RepID=A0A0E9TIW2_ANGAN